MTQVFVRHLLRSRVILKLIGSVVLLPVPLVVAAGETLTVVEREIDDLKAVFATVRSKDRIEARVRTPGTIVSLKVQEGAQIQAGQQLALVADPKIALRIKSLDAQVVGLEARVQNARVEFERVEQLRVRGVSPQSRVDQLKTSFDVAANELKSARAERLVVEEQIAEGKVLAPAAGRVLKVPVTEGSVVMPGESVATIAANQYVLRLELPERHARFMKTGDGVIIGPRGLSKAVSLATSSGTITQVYPELQGGRVLADADVPGLGDYFVGERAVVWISTGKRATIIVPTAFVFNRHGLDFVRVVGEKGDAFDVVVQVGQSIPSSSKSADIEILSGLKVGDILSRTEGK